MLLCSQNIYPRKIVFENDTCIAISVNQLKQVNQKLLLNQHLAKEKELLLEIKCEYERIILHKDSIIVSKDMLIVSYDDELRSGKESYEKLKDDYNGLVQKNQKLKKTKGYLWKAVIALTLVVGVSIAG